MNWLALILAFGVAIMVSSWLEPRVARARPGWPPRKRRVAAASLLPALILFATVLGLRFLLVSGPGENMQDLALVVTASIGLLFAALTFVAGLLGASLVSRDRAG